MLLPEGADIPTDVPPQWNAPPHIAARFSRRRRRNGTLSPAVSNQAQLSASHLATTRRATLLEARKSLLRARAQHVEKVRRSRADDSHEAVSERLLALQASMRAAQDSRNAILAKIAGACASEVAKAKRTANEMRRRREKETRDLKESFEERMKEAQRRRDVALRERGRRRRERGSRGEDAAEREKAKVQAESTSEAKRVQAASRIQRAWRLARDRKIVVDFVALGLTIESVRDADFITVSTRFQDDEVLRATSKLLMRCGLLEGIEGVEGALEKCCRTFLSSYLILGHPGEVLSNDGMKEKELIERSKDLLIAFESFLSSQTFPPPDALYNAWSEFSTAFDTWKSRDSKIFIETMVAQYAELDLIWQKVKDDTTGGVAEDFKEGIRENQLMLLVRIRRLAGDRTRDLIRTAVKDSRKNRLPKKEKRDTKPREVPSSDATTVSTVAPTPAVVMPTVKPEPPAPVQPTPPQVGFHNVASGDDGMQSNRQIIHELAMDKDFRLQPRKRSKIEAMVEDTAKTAFWGAMREDITEGKLEKWIPSLAETVRGKLLRLLDSKGSLHRAVAESMDIELIRQQCHNGSYDHEKLLSYVLNLLPKICSPARDEDVKALVEDTGDYISRLQKLLDVLEAMQLDHANFLLMISAPQVIPEAIPYERRLFAADLEAGRATLDQTRQWLLTAKSQLPAGTPANDVHVHAFLNLLFGLETLDVSSIPETFHLDHQRIRDTRETLRTVILGGAIVLTVKTLLRRDVRSSWKEISSFVGNLLRSSTSTTEIADGVRNFVDETAAVPAPTLVAVRNAVARILERGTADPVARVVANRVRGFVMERLVATNSQDKVRLAATAGEVLTGWGVGEWIGELGGVVERVATWRIVDMGVNWEWYNEILGVGVGVGA
ncbi:T-complex protein 11-domain-containing protein [Tricharina praecox]|uniref:T-complex protein 11-domain-containing protein n=1 Tax=Tricharina praecox TaxID=43433 RepID=UPI00221EBDBA|nr:T-complex protein 11-domain-containing protein [Tricharina praecox]KAI5857211.1 T-complex protein 11-domain-containing protein [Tricharina praecox]